MVDTDASNNEVIKMAPFEIISDAEAGYRPTHTSALTRTNRELIDLPQSVDILSEDFLKDTGASMMDEAFVYVANAQVRNTSAGTGPNNILIRGFANGTSFTDGIDTGSYRRDMFGYERMEVIKGPASAVQGRGTDSGYINFVLKKPMVGANFTKAGFEYLMGEHGQSGKRFTFDRNFAISKEKGLYARVAGLWDNHDHYFDFAEFKTAAIYPSIRWAPTDKTEIAVVGEFMDIHSPTRSPGHGFAWIPALYRKVIPVIGAANDPITALNLPSNFNIGGPQYGEDDDVTSILLIATHKFNDAIQYRQAVSFFNSAGHGEWWDAESNFPTAHTSISAAFKNEPGTNYDPNGIYIPVQQGFTDYDTDRMNYQGDLNIQYGSDKINFTTLVGYAYKERTQYDKDRAGSIPVRYQFINLKDPENAWEGRSVTAGSVRISRDRDSNYEELGVYIQQDVNLFNNKLLLSGGYRQDKGKTWTHDYLSGVTSAKVEATVKSWRAAGTYKLNENFSLYGISSIQNNPTAITTVWASLLPGDPRLLETITRDPTTELKEVGFKGYLFEKKLTYTFSWFEILTGGQEGNDRIDTISQAPATLGQPVLSALKKFVTNGATGTGVEFSVFGQINKRWDVNLAIGTLDTNEPITGGSRPIRHSPEWNASGFTKYSFRDNQGRGFTVRGGISAIGPFVQQVGGALSRVEMDENQWRMDLGCDYRFNAKQSIDLIVKNVTNEPYIVTRTNPTRQIRISYRAEF
jgi:outer membrane receptor for monomeric catechols